MDMNTLKGTSDLKLLYCRVGWMNSYCGDATEKPKGGGKYNIENTGHEVHNYLGYKGRYYGFVESSKKNIIRVENLCGDKKAEYAEGILVVWIARKPTGGQFIVGWYEDARVYRTLQTVPDDAMSIRSVNLQDHNSYNIFSEHVFLIPAEDRDFRVDGPGRNNIWYGDHGDFDKEVQAYILNYDREYEKRIELINNDSLIGSEKEAIVKTRVNQDKFRSGLLKRYSGRCCICGMCEDALLLASHIKPWSKSDEHEKLDLGNGLLLCPNHDRLFDKGYISFEDDGSIIISKKLNEDSRKLLNVNESMHIEVLEGNREYVRYHRDNVFS